MNAEVSTIDNTARPPLRCPKCGSTDIAEIVYNPSAMTNELLAKVQARRAVIRTGARTDTSPRFYCNYCGYEW